MAIIKKQAVHALPSEVSVIKSGVVTIAVLVAALGYFVDIFDLLLFSIVRVPSLRSLGLEGKAVTDSGIFLLNVQMIGLLIGVIPGPSLWTN